MVSKYLFLLSGPHLGLHHDHTLYQSLVTLGPNELNLQYPISLEGFVSQILILVIIANTYMIHGELFILGVYSFHCFEVYHGGHQDGCCVLDRQRLYYYANEEHIQ